MLAPLAREGIEIFAVGTDTEVYEMVARNEMAWFHAPEPTDALLLDEHRKMAFSIVSLAFKDDNKWRLHDGTSTIHATITDAGFLSRVNNSQISFSKGVCSCAMSVCSSGKLRTGQKPNTRSRMSSNIARPACRFRCRACDPRRGLAPDATSHHS